MSCVLLISPEPWDGHSVSKHHYARELVRRGHDVLFHGPPEDHGPIQLEAINEPELRGARGHLLVLRSPRVASGLRFMPSPVRRFLESSWLRKVERISGMNVDVVWNFENSRFFDMSFAGERLKIYQQVDLNQNFNPLRAATTADLSIAICEPIERRLAPVARNLMRIAHGHSDSVVPRVIPGWIRLEFEKAPVNAVLIGNLDILYLDVPLLASLVRDHPTTRFHFVGRYTAGSGLHAATARSRNVRFWGRQPSKILPAVLRSADVQLLAYRADVFPEHLANSHKLMEYLAAGRCILASRTMEYEDRPDLVVMARTRDEYARKFGEIVSNLSFWNSEEKVAIRKHFAAEHTYPRQLERIVRALGSRGQLIA